MKNNYLLSALILTVLMTGLFFSLKPSSPKIAYVRSARLVEGYTGMKEAKEMYQVKMARWQSNIDTLERDYQRSAGSYHSVEMSLAKKQEREAYLKKQELNIRQYVSALEQKAKEEDAKMTEGVLNQINSYVKEYGERKGYDLILGVTMDGNILYGKEAIDITDEVLKGMNAGYKKTAQ